jgi:hypothetical protein
MKARSFGRRRPAQPTTQGMTAGSISAAGFRQLFDRAGPELTVAGVGATFGTTAGVGGGTGPTWISVTSPWGYGRLTRWADGSFEGHAYRIPGGELVCGKHGEDVRPEHLDELIAAVGRPTHEEPSPVWRNA